MANFMSRLSKNTDETATDLSRRGLLISATASGVAFGFAGAAQAAMDPTVPDGTPVSANGQTFEPSMWYWIDADGLVNVNIIRAEMGQHVGTSIARILADELEVSWDNVRITHVDTAEKWGTMVTGGSWSVWQSWPIYRKAGAAGRKAFIGGGEMKWGVNPGSGHGREGVVSEGTNEISYGALVSEGLEL